MEAPDSEPDIKFVWNATPNSKVQQARSIIHPAFHYTPFSEQNITTVDYPPLLCSCEALLNKFCTIDFSRKTVKCCFCNATVNLPPNYAKNIEPDRLPYEFIYDSMEFVTKNKKSQVNNIQIPSSSSNCFLFVVDLCLSDK